MHFFGLYYTIILQCVVQKTLNKILATAIYACTYGTLSYDLCDIKNKLLLLW